MKLQNPQWMIYAHLYLTEETWADQYIESRLAPSSGQIELPRHDSYAPRRPFNDYSVGLQDHRVTNCSEEVAANVEKPPVRGAARVFLEEDGV